MRAKDRCPGHDMAEEGKGIKGGDMHVAWSESELIIGKEDYKEDLAVAESVAAREWSNGGAEL